MFRKRPRRARRAPRSSSSGSPPAERCLAPGAAGARDRPALDGPCSWGSRSRPCSWCRRPLARSPAPLPSRRASRRPASSSRGSRSRRSSTWRRRPSTIRLPGGPSTSGVAGRAGFTAVPLTWSDDDENLSARIPASALAGDVLDEYAVVRDPGSGASLTVPSAGAARPYRSWIVRTTARGDDPEAPIRTHASTRRHRGPGGAGGRTRRGGIHAAGRGPRGGAHVVRHRPRRDRVGPRRGARAIARVGPGSPGPSEPNRAPRLRGGGPCGGPGRHHLRLGNEGR